LKKVFSLLLMVIILFCVTGCNKKNKENNNSSDNSTSGVIHAEDTTESSNNNTSEDKNTAQNESDESDNKSHTDSSGNNSSNATESDIGTDSSQSDNHKNDSSTDDETEKEPAYKDIICQRIPENGWKTVELVSETENLCISLSIPKNWEINDGKIMKNGKQIGNIQTNAPKNSKNSYEIFSLNSATTVFRRSIEEYSIDGKIEYKRLFKVSNYSETVGKNIFFITVNYNEIDNSAATKMLSSFSYLGKERILPEIKNDSKIFLILGNSFLNTSKIADFLSDFLITDGGNYAVEIRFGGTIVDFANDQTLISEIENGNFAYIFQCGFYFNNAHNVTVTEAFKTILDACQKSDTALAAFPAHNEHNVEINNVLQAYDNLYCLSWKEEINSLIESGFSATTLTQNDFCINDNFKHSTPLAGYVGAHLIYRNIFSKIPPDLSDTAPLDMGTINSKLLTYPSTGIVPGKAKIIKYYI